MQKNMVIGKEQRITGGLDIPVYIPVEITENMGK